MSPLSIGPGLSLRGCQRRFHRNVTQPHQGQGSLGQSVTRALWHWRPSQNPRLFLQMCCRPNSSLRQRVLDRETIDHRSRDSLLRESGPQDHWDARLLPEWRVVLAIQN